MVYTGVYALLLALHLLTAVFLIGPAAVAAMTSPRLVRSGDAAGLRAAARGTRLYTLASLLTVVLGSALVAVSGGSSGAPEWSMGDPWVSASYALWFVAVALVLVVVVPAQEAAAQALEQGGTAVASRIAAAGGAATLCWAAIVVLMVYKPGA